MQRDQDGSKVFGPGVPIPPVPLALDAIRGWRRTAGTDTYKRAAAAIYFIRETRTASIAHPSAETEHAIPRTRCPRCQKRSLKWKPPAHFLDLVVVACRDDSCGFIADQTSFETLAVIEKPLKPTETPEAAA